MSRLHSAASLQLPGPADIRTNHLCISIATILLLASFFFFPFQKLACSHDKGSELFPKGTVSLNRKAMLKGPARTVTMFCPAFKGILSSFNAYTYLQMKKELQCGSSV